MKYERKIYADGYLNTLFNLSNLNFKAKEANEIWTVVNISNKKYVV